MNCHIARLQNDAMEQMFAAAAASNTDINDINRLILEQLALLYPWVCFHAAGPVLTLVNNLLRRSIHHTLKVPEEVVLLDIVDNLHTSLHELNTAFARHSKSDLFGRYDMDDLHGGKTRKPKT